MDEVGRKDLLGVTEVAGYLGVNHVTVYRWCREGRLPCLKVGKSWRIRREALEDFLRGSERPVSLVGYLRGFLEVPDSVIGIAETTELLHRLDAAFFRVGEARGGLLVKFHGGEAASAEELRDDLERNGLAVRRLEEEGRFRFSAEADPGEDRTGALEGIFSDDTGSGRTVWATFDWTERVDLDAALGQQEALAEMVRDRQVVVKTAVLEEVADDWEPAARRRARLAHSGVIRISEAGLTLSRLTPLPPD
jgi:excisionase family DNA binding protein